MELIPSGLLQSAEQASAAEPALLSASSRLSSSLLASVTVDFDGSVFLQMALFAMLVVALKPLLFDPMLKVFALREERTDGAKAEARAMQERAAAILSSYEKEVAKVKADATAERDQLRRETAAAEAEILTTARNSADAIAAEGERTIESEIAGLQKELDAKAGELSRQIAGSVLGREVSA